MLSTIREKTQGWKAFILLAVIALPFGLWGIDSYFNGNASNDVAKVDGTAISKASYLDVLKQQRIQYEQMLGRNVDSSLFDNPMFKQAALNTLINRILLIHDADQAGYRVPDAELGGVIRSMPEFQRDGHFDPALYQQLLANAGYTIPQFESMERANVLLAEFQAGILQSAFVTHDDVNSILALMAQKRQIAYAVLDPKVFPVAVSASQVAAYYQQHSAEFRTPEQVRLAYVHLTPGAVAGAVDVSDAALRRLYERHLGEFTVAGERRASHILIAVPANANAQQKQQALSKADLVVAQLKAGAPFAALARKYSDDSGSAPQGGDLGFIRPGTMPAAFDKVLFSLKPGQVGGPVETRYGYHIIKLTAVKPEKVKPFQAVRTELKRMAQRSASADEIPDLADRLRRLAYAHPESLAPAASALHLEVKETGWITSQGAGAGVAANPLVLRAAFEPAMLTSGRNSNVLRLGTHSYVAFRIAGHRPATQIPLAQVRSRIETALTTHLQQQRAKAAAEALLGRVQHGDTPVLPAGARWLTPAPFMRTSAGALDPELLAAVFAAPAPVPGKTVSGLAPLTGGGYAVFVLRAVIPGTPAEAPVAVRGETRQLLEDYRGADYYRDYLAGLRKKAKIKIYSKNL